VCVEEGYLFVTVIIANVCKITVTFNAKKATRRGGRRNFVSQGISLLYWFSDTTAYLVKVCSRMIRTLQHSIAQNYGRRPKAEAFMSTS